jgi:hypothetical protein
MSGLRPSHQATLLAAFALLATPVPVSDPVGIYALIDRVVLEPNETAPTHIQIWGVFSQADGRSGDGYLPAQRGFMYFSARNSNPRATLAEWADMKTVAGSGQSIGFGGRYSNNGRVRQPSEQHADPDPYPLGFGLVKLMTGHARTLIAYELERVPTPISPADGATVKAGTVRLVARNVADQTLKYVFEIESNGQKEASTALAPGSNNETAWTPKLKLVAGNRYTWRVWAVKDQWQGNIALANFRAGN